MWTFVHPADEPYVNHQRNTMMYTYNHQRFQEVEAYCRYLENRLDKLAEEVENIRALHEEEHPREAPKKTTSKNPTDLE